ncbi:MAG: response regulator [Planctomycetota bacterium]|nr:MAG: response regulator [Planctomycetota bacterium]
MNRKKHIMFVDDERPVLDSIARCLRRRRNEWDLDLVQDPEEACDRLAEESYDALVTDLKMPKMDGLELVSKVQEFPHNKNMPVVVLTGMDDDDLKERALESGAFDLLNKPVRSRQLTARIESLLKWKERQDELEQITDRLNEQIARQQALLARQRLEVVFRLGMVAEHRDTETGNHVVRVACFSRLIAETLGLPPEDQQMLLLASPLHDIGKIAIPDAVLLKSGPLTPGEWTLMQKHCIFGEQILRGRASVMAPLLNWYHCESPGDAVDPLLDTAAVIALTHHEKWDGTGYPIGLAGEKIPLVSRITAVSDVFDALTSRRPYKQAGTSEAAIDYLRRTSGRHFDPQVVAAFERRFDDIIALKEHIRDSADAFRLEESLWM